MGAAFLCAVSGISPPTIEQSASYLQGWIKVLKGDKRLVVGAASAAQKATDWILGENFNNARPPPDNETINDPSDQTPPPKRNGPTSQLDLF
ncbi:hypothetical protein Enr8_23300 [Blastopirellula retiformator]|uniref:Polyvalent protein metallopeptidase domain-containing protein n=1 Tax=Blastopirellula retiformator TaxID=2527970 RepID=A0A5C5VBD6_9BACT|nr:hypothetical protein Enr8_23300 [Blastopirellula retiformator]